MFLALMEWAFPFVESLLTEFAIHTSSPNFRYRASGIQYLASDISYLHSHAMNGAQTRLGR